MTYQFLCRMAIALMSLWLGVSVLCQFPGKLIQGIRRWDLIGLIPIWSFFAPNPGTADYYLLFRDRMDGEFGEWHEINLCDDRHPLQLFWNSGKREKKVLIDLVSALIGQLRQDVKEAIQVSVPYLAILTYVAALPRWYPARETQFMLMTTDIRSVGLTPEPIFLSEIHTR